LRGKQRQAAQIHRNEGERSEQHGRITPAQRSVAQRTDRQRDELFGQRRMHRVEHRLRHHGLEHLPRRRDVMHLVEIEFLWSCDADEHREMRDDEDNSSDDGAAHHRLRENGM
jgi:hypothetical protein